MKATREEIVEVLDSLEISITHDIPAQTYRDLIRTIDKAEDDASLKKVIGDFFWNYHG